MNPSALVAMKRTTRRMGREGTGTTRTHGRWRARVVDGDRIAPNPQRERLRDDRDPGAQGLRRETAVPLHSYRALRSVQAHDPPEDLEAIRTLPDDPGAEELRRILGLREVDDRAVAVLLELALEERGDRPGDVRLRHTSGATLPCAIRTSHAAREPRRRRISAGARAT